ncbi:MAG: hypothetical protein JKY48_00575 [Flavobacteriales bacterium]|nr:hypothetical protein [Flavobacteriales bacterium]
MYELVDKPKGNKSRAIANSFARKKSVENRWSGLEDNRDKHNKPIQRILIRDVKNDMELEKLDQEEIINCKVKVVYDNYVDVICQNQTERLWPKDLVSWDAKGTIPRSSKNINVENAKAPTWPKKHNEKNMSSLEDDDSDIDDQVLLESQPKSKQGRYDKLEWYRKYPNLCIDGILWCTGRGDKAKLAVNQKQEWDHLDEEQNGNIDTAEKIVNMIDKYMGKGKEKNIAEFKRNHSKADGIINKNVEGQSNRHGDAHEGVGANLLAMNKGNLNVMIKSSMPEDAIWEEHRARKEITNAIDNYSKDMSTYTSGMWEKANCPVTKIWLL